METQPIEDISNYLTYYTHGHYLTKLIDTDTVVVSLLITDSKPYWRKELYPGYKASRPVRKLRVTDIPAMFSFPSWEADDIIATIVSCWLIEKGLLMPNNDMPALAGLSEYDEVHICTVDTDLLTLCVDPGIHWFCTKGYEPAHRCSDSYGDWWNRKLKHLKKSEIINRADGYIKGLFNKPKNANWDYCLADELRVTKYVCGDISDDVPPFSDPVLTDLWQIPYSMLDSVEFGVKMQRYLNKRAKKEHLVPDKQLHMVNTACNGFTTPPIYDRE